jgi:hypothetical protein
MTGFIKLIINVVRSDWTEFGKFIIRGAGAILICIAVFRRMPKQGPDIVKGLLLGMTCASTYGWAQFCFTTQRYRGSLKKLLEKNTPMQVVISKYVSAFSMSLFMMNVPGLLMRDSEFMLYLNSGVLLLTALCMAAAVVSKQPSAPLVPLIFVAVPTLYLRDQLKDQFDWIAANASFCCLLALGAIPFIIYFSGKSFEAEIL